MNGDFKALAEELKRHIDVSADAVRADLGAVAEGVLAVREQIEEFRSEVNQRFDDTHAVVKLSYSQLASRIDTLESRIEKLEASVFGARQ